MKVRDLLKDLNIEAVFVGFGISLFGVVLILVVYGLALDAIFSGGQGGGGVGIVLILGAFAALAFGGYQAAVIAKHNELAHGLIVGIILIGIIVWFTGIARLADLPWLIFISLIFLMPVGGSFLRSLRKKKDGAQSVTPESLL